MLYYAIGDIHGCNKALKRILKKIRADAETRAKGQDWRIVLLGDYVNRGPDTAKVLDRVIKLVQQGHIALPGNHEAVMHAALTAEADDLDRACERWWLNGAKQTLKSYGLRNPSRRTIRTGITLSPEHHRKFLKSILKKKRVFHRDEADGLFFVHAGVRPEKTASQSTKEVFLWSRAPNFMAPDGPRWVDDLTVVHGHTPVKAPEVYAHRVGLDTGAVYGGRLSAGVFEDGQLTEILSVKP